jgi:CMP-N,N'-diacetyllegionaminic acid synthase
MKTVAIITARGGSKRLPRKNLLPLAGLPMIVHTLRAANASARVTKTYVTTDCKEIASIALLEGAHVIKRPPDLAEDHSTSEEVLRHALVEIGRLDSMPDAFCLLQPTSPLRTGKHIDEAIDTFYLADSRPTLSVKCAPNHINKILLSKNGFIKPYFESEFYGGGGTMKDIFIPNGAIYIVNVKYFLETGNIYSDEMVPYVMNEESSVDIDTAFDLLLAEAAFSLKKRDF